MDDDVMRRSFSSSFTRRDRCAPFHSFHRLSMEDGESISKAPTILANGEFCIPLAFFEELLEKLLLEEKMEGKDKGKPRSRMEARTSF